MRLASIRPTLPRPAPRRCPAGFPPQPLLEHDIHGDHRRKRATSGAIARSGQRDGTIAAFAAISATTLPAGRPYGHCPRTLPAAALWIGAGEFHVLPHLDQIADIP